MSSNFSVSEDVAELVKEIIEKNSLQHVSDIKYEPGSEAGDGYASRTIAVDVIDERKPLHMFLKCALNLKAAGPVPAEKLYTTEIYFYDVVYPAYLKFLEERGVKDGFRNAPKCYATSTKNIIALENLKAKGFALFDRTQMMNESHIVLAFKTFAKFHAISFAYKDQKREEYDKFVANTFDYFSNMSKIPGFDKVVERLINMFVEKLDPAEDKHIVDKFDGLAPKLFQAMTSAQKSLNEYSIITQGDCWCNNMMFFYEGQDTKNPIDIMLIDWQVLRPASPVFDISFFFYAIASKEALDKLPYYLRIYHDELSKQIKQLGSDPETLYPFEVFQAEWKKHCVYGFAMSFNLVRQMLVTKEDAVLTMEDVDLENGIEVEKVAPKMKQQDQYVVRMKVLANHMVQNDCL